METKDDFDILEGEEIDESKLELPLWMQEKMIKDKNGNRPNHPKYDPTSILIP